MAAITLEELLKRVDVRSEKLDVSISDDHLRAIAIFLTSWRKVATYLELSENDLDDVGQEGKDEQDKRLKALQMWKGKFGFKATYRKLVEVLLRLTKADIAERVLLLLKDSHRAEKEAIDVELQEKNAEIERLKRELQALRAEINVQLQQKDDQIQQKDTELQEQQRKLQTLREDKGRLEAKVAVKDAEIDRQQRELQTLREERERLQAEVEARPGQKLILEEKNAEIGRQQRELQTLRGQNTAKDQRLAAVRSQLQQLQAEVNVRSAQVQQQLRERDAEINRLRRELRDETASRDESVASMQSPLKKPKPCSPSELRLTCRRLQDMPIALRNPESVTVDAMVYITQKGWDSVIHKYDPQTQEWSKLPEYQYLAFTMAEVNNELVLVGGQDKPTWDKHTYKKPRARDAVAVYSTSQRRWEQPYPPMNTPRCWPAASTYHQHLVVAGGSDGDYLATVEILDTSTPRSQWLSIISMSLPMRCGQMLSAIVQDTLYLLGGTLQTQVLSVSLSALTQADKPPKQWHSLPDAPLDNASVVGVHGSLLAVGGSNQGFQGSSAIHIYDQEKNAWNKVGDLPTVRSSCTCCLLPNGEILIAGGLDNSGNQTKRMDVAAATVCD